jgi:fructoselysine-6-P-deglycase FrlB-like protein
MAIKPTAYAQSETYKEILSQGDVWQSVLQELKQSTSGERMLRSNNQKRSWLFVGCGTSFYLADAAATSWTLLTGELARAVPGSEILLYPALTRDSDLSFRTHLGGCACRPRASERNADAHHWGHMRGEE